MISSSLLPKSGQTGLGPCSLWSLVGTYWFDKMMHVRIKSSPSRRRSDCTENAPKNITFLPLGRPIGCPTWPIPLPDTLDPSMFLPIHPSPSLRCLSYIELKYQCQYRCPPPSWTPWNLQRSSHAHSSVPSMFILYRTRTSISIPLPMHNINIDININTPGPADIALKHRLNHLSL